MGGQRQSGKQTRMVIRVLGGFRVEVDGQRVTDDCWHRVSARTLLKLLVCAQDHRRSRQEIAQILHPEGPHELQSAAFRQALFAARHALEPNLRGDCSTYLHSAGETMTLDGPDLTIDLDDFRSLAQSALTSSASRDRNKSLHELVRAAEAYEGDLLPEDLYCDWAVQTREEARSQYMKILMAIARIAEQHGDVEVAVARLRECVEMAPTSEDVHRQLMRLYALQGARHRVRHQFETCRAILDRDCDAEPEDLTVELYQRLMCDPCAVPQPSREESGLPRAALSLPLPLVGQRRVLDVVRSTLDECASGEGRTLLISGEDGAGKTRIAQETARLAWEAGFCVLWGTAYEHESDAPYGCLADALESRLRCSDTETRMAVAAIGAPLGDVVPSLKNVLRSTSVRSDQPLNPASAFFRALDWLAAGRPLLVVLDDVEHADPDTLAVLAHIGAVYGSRPWLIVCTVGAQGSSEPVSTEGWLHDRRQDPRSTCVTLRPLSHSECDELVRLVLGKAEVSGRSLARIYDLSLGNPLHAVELALSVVETAAGDDFLDEPRGLADMVLLQLRHLSREEQWTLQVASIIGTEFSVTVLGEALHTPTEHMFAILTALMNKHVLRERGELFAFRQPFLRSVLYSHQTAPRRRVLHGMVAAVLERLLPNELDAVAHHYRAAGNTTRTLYFTERAGDRAMGLHAFAVAAMRFRLALDMTLPHDKPAWARVAEKLGTALMRLGKLQAASTMLEQVAIETASLVDDAATIRLAVKRAELAAVMGQPTVGTRILRATAQIANVASARDRAQIFQMYAHLYQQSGRYRLSLASARAAEHVARVAGESSQMARVCTQLGTALITLGDLEGALDVLNRGVNGAVRSGDETTVAIALSEIARIHELRGNFTAATACLRRALRLSDREENPLQIADNLQRLGRNAYFLGDWDMAHRYLKQAVDLATATGPSWVDPYPSIELGRLLLGQGAQIRAEALLTAGCVSAQEREDLRAVRSAQRCLAEIDLDRSHGQQAIKRIEPWLDRPGLQEADVTALLPVLARAHSAGGSTDRALDILSQALDRAHREGRVLTVMETEAARGMVFLQQGQLDRSEAALLSALYLSRSMKFPYARGCSDLSLALLYQRRGERDRAVKHLGKAQTTLTRLGVERYLNLTPATLSAL